MKFSSKAQTLSTHFVFIAFSLLALLSGEAFAAADLSLSSTQFAAAAVGRTFMDVGGAWNGTTDVTAATDYTFRFTIADNPTAISAFKLAASVTLVSGFTYVSGRAIRFIRRQFFPPYSVRFRHA